MFRFRLHLRSENTLVKIIYRQGPRTWVAKLLIAWGVYHSYWHFDRGYWDDVIMRGTREEKNANHVCDALYKRRKPVTYHLMAHASRMWRKWLYNLKIRWLITMCALLSLFCSHFLLLLKPCCVVLLWLFLVIYYVYKRLKRLSMLISFLLYSCFHFLPFENHH